MNITQLRETLQRAASLFKSGGADSQAAALEATERLLADSGDETVQQFVERSKAPAITSAPTTPIDVDALVQNLYDWRSDPESFTQAYKTMEGRTFDKATAIAVASKFLGLKPKHFKTKPEALRAIKQKFDDRLYLASKSAMNSKVTPW
jgi:hypothetical protein